MNVAKEQNGLVKAPPGAPRGVTGCLRGFAESVMALNVDDGKAATYPSGTGPAAGIMVGIEVASGRKFRGYAANGAYYWVRVK